MSQTRTLTVANVSSLDVTAEMTLSQPFFLLNEETGAATSELLVRIATGESLHVTVLFSTAFKQDRHNETADGQLTICYAEHQHSDQIALTGHIFFPNLYLETGSVDFGCILNNTEAGQDLKVTNIGPLLVHYKWKFVLDKDNVAFNLRQQGLSESEAHLLDLNQHRVTSESNLESQVADVEAAASEKEEPGVDRLGALLNRGSPVLPSIEEVFDISPLYGTLHPGEAQKMRVSYFGHKDVRAYVRAVCEVTNGPSYELTLKGEASVLNYEISSHQINFDFIVRAGF